MTTKNLRSELSNKPLSPSNIKHYLHYQFSSVLDLLLHILLKCDTKKERKI